MFSRLKKKLRCRATRNPATPDIASPSPRTRELASLVWSIDHIRLDILQYLDCRVSKPAMAKLLTLDKRSFPEVVLALFSGVRFTPLSKVAFSTRAPLQRRVVYQRSVVELDFSEDFLYAHLCGDIDTIIAQCPRLLQLFFPQSEMFLLGGNRFRLHVTRSLAIEASGTIFPLTFEHHLPSDWNVHVDFDITLITQMPVSVGQDAHPLATVNIQRLSIVANPELLIWLFEARHHNRAAPIPWVALMSAPTVEQLSRLAAAARDQLQTLLIGTHFEFTTFRDVVSFNWGGHFPNLSELQITYLCRGPADDYEPDWTFPTPAPGPNLARVLIILFAGVFASNSVPSELDILRNLPSFDTIARGLILMGGHCRIPPVVTYQRLGDRGLAVSVPVSLKLKEHIASFEDASLAVGHTWCRHCYPPS